MPRFPRVLLALAACAVAACGGDDPAPIVEPPLVLPPLRLQLVAGGLTNATHAIAPPGDARLFIVEQRGVVRVRKDGQLLPTPFLDITARVSQAPEDGLLSMAFDPQFATNGFVYLYFVNRDGDIEVDRFTASGDVADPTASTVIVIPHPGSQIHNGGIVTFGPDGMMYLAPGDGIYTDPANNAQNLGVLLGKVLRIDVRTLPYTIPPDNPYVGQQGRRGEIWARGLRNPWRFAIDAPPGDTARIWIADVGHEAREEVNVAPLATPALNYGWKIMEASQCWPQGSQCSTSGLTLPVHDYGRTAGCSVTGGVVYRGTAIPELAGQYVFSDYCEGGLRSIARTPGGGWTTRSWSIDDVEAVRSFGVDGAGELYLVTPGTVYRVVKQ